MSSLRLENQLCFPLYAASKSVIKNYTPLLKKLNLTYTQYITMMVLWDVKEIGLKELGARLYLDSGTLSPLLKRLENEGYLTRERNLNDERNIIIRITDKGIKTKEKAQNIPLEIKNNIKLNDEELVQLYNLLYKILT